MKRDPRLLITLVAVVTWGAGLILGFFLDDLHNLEQALAAPLTWDGLARGFTVFDPATIEVWCLDRSAVHFFRPLFLLSLKLDYAVWGLSPFGFHLTNLILHILNSLMVHRFLRLTGVASRPALFAGMLFAGFPHHTVAVLWVSGRTELLMATFVLAALVGQMRSMHGARWWAWRMGALVAATCAFLTKEGAVVLVPMLLMADWLVRDREASLGRLAASMAKRLWPFMLLTAGYLVYRLGIMGLGEHPPMPYFVSPSEPIFPYFLAIKTVYYYLCWLMALPIMPVAPVAFLMRHWWAAAAAAALVLAGWGAVMWRLRGGQRDAPVWMLWTMAGLAPTATVMASNHYTYLANIGVALLAVYYIAAIPKERLRKIQIGVSVGICALHAGMGVANYHSLGATNQQLAEELISAVPEVLEGDGDLYLVNLPFAAAHTGQRLRLLHHAHGLRAHMLTVSSEPFEPGPAPKMEWRGPRELSLHLPEGWRTDELVEMFLMMGVDMRAGRSYPAGEASVIPVASDRGGDIDRLELAWDEDADLSRQYLVLVRQGADDEIEVVRLRGQP